MDTMRHTFGPPPGLEANGNNVSLTSIASLLVAKSNHNHHNNGTRQVTVTICDPKTKSPLRSSHLNELHSNRQKRSTELAAVANNCALNNDFEAAVSFFTDAIELNSNDFRFYCNRSFCFENMKQFENALKDAEKAIHLNPHRPKPYFRKGRALFGLKKYELAEEAFKQVLRIDPECEATNAELVQVRYVALRNIGFDIDTSLLAAKRCSSISEAIDFAVNIELLSMKTEEFKCENEDLTSNGSNLVIDSLIPEFGRNKSPEFKQKRDNSSLHSFARDSSSPCSDRFETREREVTEYWQRKECETLPTNLFGYKGLWVGNIYPKTNISMLRSLFSRFGKVQSIKVLKDKFCAFISYDNPNSPRKAIATLHDSCVE
ncbi:uncharacterized protein B4U79_06689, partial [Dinothrombium tinctorium]